MWDGCGEGRRRDVCGLLEGSGERGDVIFVAKWRFGVGLCFGEVDGGVGVCVWARGLAGMDEGLRWRAWAGGCLFFRAFRWGEFCHGWPCLGRKCVWLRIASAGLSSES